MQLSIPHMYVYFTALCICLGYSACSHRITLSGLESPRTELQRQQEQSSTQDASSLEKFSRESIPETISEKPLIKDWLQQRCTHTLSSDQNLLFVRGDYAILKGTKGYFIYNLKTCQRSPFKRPKNRTILSFTFDPDTTRVLILENSSTQELHASIIDLATQNVLKTLQMSGRWFMQSSAMFFTKRRGFYIYSSIGPGDKVFSVLYYHFSDVQLVKIPIISQQAPPYIPAFSRTQNTLYLSSNYALVFSSDLGRTKRNLQIWSVLKQKHLDLITLTKRVFRSVLITDEAIYFITAPSSTSPKTELVRYNLLTKTQTVIKEAAGCRRLYGRRQSPILGCLGQDVVHRISKRTGAFVSSSRLSPKSIFITHYLEDIYTYTLNKHPLIQRTHFGTQKPSQSTWSIPPDIQLAPSAVQGPHLWTPSSHLQNPFSYKVLRGIKAQQHILLVLDLKKQKLQIISKTYPFPATMGRLTEFFHFYPNGFSYVFESANQKPPTVSSLVHIRPAAEYKRSSWVSPQGFTNVHIGLGLLRRIQATLHPNSMTQPTQQIVRVVDHQYHRIKQWTVNNEWKLHSSDQHVVLTSSKQKILKSYLVR